jgi:hypothetical protein
MRRHQTCVFALAVGELMHAKSHAIITIVVISGHKSRQLVLYPLPMCDGKESRKLKQQKLY